MTQPKPSTLIFFVAITPLDAVYEHNLQEPGDLNGYTHPECRHNDKFLHNHQVDIF